MPEQVLSCVQTVEAFALQDVLQLLISQVDRQHSVLSEGNEDNP